MAKKKEKKKTFLPSKKKSQPSEIWDLRQFLIVLHIDSNSTNQSSFFFL